MKITLEGDLAKIGTKKAVPIDKFCHVVANNCLTGLSKTPIPDGVKWIVEKGDNAVCIVEIPPQLNSISYSNLSCNCDACRSEHELSGNEGTFTVATPYIVLKVPFLRNRFHGHVEVFYRNKPLSSIDDGLFLTNLPNSSPSLNAGAGWICSEKALANYSVSERNALSREDILGAVVHHIFGGEFNMEVGSSDNFHKFQARDERLSSMPVWQQASLKDPRFVLGVKWIGANRTVKGVIENHFENIGAKLTPSVPALNNLLLKAS